MHAQIDLTSPLVLAVFDEVVDDRRIGQGRRIAQRAKIVRGGLAQDAAHDLAGASLNSGKLLTLNSQAEFASGSRRTVEQ